MASTNNAINLSAAGMVHYDGNGTFAGDSTTQHAIIIGAASNNIASLAVATNGQLPIGSAGADPVLSTLTAGAGVTITNGAGSITISASSSLYPWTTVTTTSQAMAVNNGYTANNASLVTLSLPASANVGDTIIVMGLGAGGWTITQGSGQEVILGNALSTVGTGGSLSSTNRYDSVTITCLVANTTFVARSSMGNITVA